MYETTKFTHFVVRMSQFSEQCVNIKCCLKLGKKTATETLERLSINDWWQGVNENTAVSKNGGQESNWPAVGFENWRNFSKTSKTWYDRICAFEDMVKMNMVIWFGTKHFEWFRNVAPGLCEKIVPRSNGKLTKLIVVKLFERPTDENGVFPIKNCYWRRYSECSLMTRRPKQITCCQIPIEGQSWLRYSITNGGNWTYQTVHSDFGKSPGKRPAFVSCDFWQSPNEKTWKRRTTINGVARCEKALEQ